ncbi:MAG: hypothetical protein EHM72_03890 [Calditrichaeota bacterium]|nr:MAG: hypothetical protein EHM72_03890 [Calditrichota bacterium]
MHKRWLYVCSVLFLCCTSDKSPYLPSAEQPVFSYGNSFGYCMGYCYSTLTITSGKAVLVKSSRNALPDREWSENLAAGEWAQLVKSFRWTEFQSLPDTLGCPDCADGGAEWIQAAYPTEKKRVTFEYGDDLPGFTDLLSLLRQIFTRLDAKLDEGNVVVTLN